MIRIKKAISLTLMLVFLFSAMATVAYAGSPRAGVGVFIDGKQFSSAVSIKDNTTFVGIRKFSQAMYPDARVSYNYSTRTLTVTTGKLYLSARDGDYYIIANGRYLYTSSPVFMRYGVMYAPVLLMAKAFDSRISWNNYNSSFSITRGSGGILSADKFYREDEVLWLARIINAESGGEILKGKIAVGNVILNRVRSPYFPNTIYGVIFDRKNGVQFSPVSNGTIYKSPNAQSIIAAKICLEGYSVNTSILYFVNPTLAPNSWVVKNRPLYAKIGNHAFFY